MNPLITRQTLVNNETEGPAGVIDSAGNSAVGGNAPFKGGRGARRGETFKSLIALSKVQVATRRGETARDTDGNSTNHFNRTPFSRRVSSPFENLP